MPPKGGNTDLTDDEVHRAVVYLANQVGAGWKEPAPTAVASTAPAPAAAAAAAADAPPRVSGSAHPPLRRLRLQRHPPRRRQRRPPLPQRAAAKADGKAVYEKTCAVCHATGLAGAPKFGDKAAWAPRIATGIDALHNSALHGKNAMPPKGGNTGAVRRRRDGRRRLHGRGSQVADPGQRRISGHGESNDKRSSEIHL